MTVTLQNEVAEKARQQAVKAKATVDEAIGWLRSAASRSPRLPSPLL